MERIKRLFHTRRSRSGAFAAGLTAVVLAVLILVNVLAAQLPASVLAADISGMKLYTVSDTSVEFLKTLDKDVEIILVAKSVDERVTKFLDNYRALNSHISVTQIDPSQNPTVLDNYGTESNTVVVLCPETGKQEIISLSDIIVYDQVSYYVYGELKETAFDCEGQITSAVNYVTADQQRNLYLLGGHDETELAQQAADIAEKANFNMQDLTLTGSVPEDCDLLFCYAPSQDLADSELAAIRAYMAAGGQMVLMLDRTDVSGMPNWESFLAEYGLTQLEGYVAEMDSANYLAAQGYFFIFPQLDTGAESTESLAVDGSVLVYYVRPLELGTPARSTITVTPFLSSSDTGVNVVDEDTVVEGSHPLGVVATEGESRLTVLSTDTMIQEGVVSTFPNLSNMDLFSNMLTAGFDDMKHIAIPAKSLEVPTNAMTATGSWSVLFIGVIPCVLLILGFVRWAHRRKL